MQPVSDAKSVEELSVVVAFMIVHAMIMACGSLGVASLSQKERVWGH